VKFVVPVIDTPAMSGKSRLGSKQLPALTENAVFVLDLVFELVTRLTKGIRIVTVVRAKAIVADRHKLSVGREGEGMSNTAQVFLSQGNETGWIFSSRMHYLPPPQGA
jgi:hypothetical protein